MAKVLKSASVRQQIRERDLQEELTGEEAGGKKSQEKQVTNDEKLFGKDKDVAQLDPFFVEVDNDEQVSKS